MQTNNPHAAESPTEQRSEMYQDRQIKPTVLQIVSGIITDSRDLFTAELALARREITTAVDDAKAGIAGIAIGAAIAFGGFGALVAAAILGLSLVMEGWLAALIVGVALLVLGLVLVNSGKNKVSPEAFKQTRAIRSMEKDAQAVRRSL